MFPVNLSHFRFCYVLREVLGSLFIAQRKFMRERFCSYSILGHPLWNGVLRSGQSPGSATYRPYTAQEQGPGITVIPGYPQGIGSRTHLGYQNPQMLKFQSPPFVSTVLHLSIQPTTNCVVLYVFLEKNSYVSGPAQFKPIFKC